MQSSIATLLTDEVFLRIFLDTMPVGVFIVDHQRHVVRANEYLTNMVEKDLARVLDTRPGDVINCMHVDEDSRGCGFGPSCDSCVLLHNTLGALEQEQSTYLVEHDVQVRTGGAAEQVRHLRISIAPLIVPEREALALIALEDITEIKHNERKAADRRVAHEQLRVLNETIGAVSHELSQPLQALLGSVELTVYRSGGDQRLADMLQTVRESVEHISAVVRQMQSITSYNRRAYANGIDIVDLTADGDADPVPAADAP